MRALRRVFFITGLILTLGNDIVVQLIFRASDVAEVIFPGDLHSQGQFLGYTRLLFLSCGALCLVTSWGMKRGKPWARVTGLWACTLLLPGVPWLSLLALAGMFVLLARWKQLGPLEEPAQAAAKLSQDYWIRKKRQTTAQGILVTIILVLGWRGFAFIEACAQALRIPAWRPGLAWLAYLFLFRLAITAIHEMGHAVMSWAVLRCVRVISIGPFIYSNVGHGNTFQFHWRRLLSSGGFVCPVPRSAENLRAKIILVTAAGPAASMLGGMAMLAMLAVCFSAPGSSLQIYWWIPAFLGMLGITDWVMNLIPVGYADGTMLLHLILWTRPGQQLLARYAVIQIHEEAELLHDRADFEGAMRLFQTALDRALEAGEDNTFCIALCRLALGEAKLATGDWQGAEAEIRKCLEFEAECAAEPILTAYAHSGLQWAAVERHHVVEVGRAYAAAVGVMEKRITTPDHVGIEVKRYRLAEVHARAGSFGKALAEINETLRTLPADRDRLFLRAQLYALKSQCELGSAGSFSAVDESSLAAARRAAEIIRSGEIPPARQNRAWNELGNLGVTLWQSGESALAIDLLREAIQQLESNGAAAAAVRQRIKLAAVLRELGRLDDAWHCLPAEDALSPYSRHSLLEERARLLLLESRPPAGRRTCVPQDAACGGMAACRELLALGHPDAIAETAVAEALLAEALFQSGDYPQAEALARKAADVLGPWQHCEAATCLITLALAQWCASAERAEILVDEAFRIIQSDPLLSPAARIRRRDSQMARLERHGFIQHGLPGDAPGAQQPAPLSLHNLALAVS